jgi:threonine dehydrogenase-like Zn-dependent dehydrogenase
MNDERYAVEGTVLYGPRDVRFEERLIQFVFVSKIHPGQVFDLILQLDQVAEGYRAMDERRAIKTLLRP